jgi:hypothetical protein
MDTLSTYLRGKNNGAYIVSLIVPPHMRIDSPGIRELAHTLNGRLTVFKRAADMPFAQCVNRLLTEEEASLKEHYYVVVSGDRAHLASVRTTVQRIVSMDSPQWKRRDVRSFIPVVFFDAFFSVKDGMLQIQEQVPDVIHGGTKRMFTPDDLAFLAHESARLRRDRLLRYAA